MPLFLNFQPCCTFSFWSELPSWLCIRCMVGWYRTNSSEFITNNLTTLNCFKFIVDFLKIVGNPTATCDVWNAPVLHLLVTFTEWSSSSSSIVKAFLKLTKRYWHLEFIGWLGLRFQIKRSFRFFPFPDSRMTFLQNFRILSKFVEMYTLGNLPGYLYRKVCTYHLGLRNKKSKSPI